MSAKVAVVTGGSSGIGLCTARALAARGYKVYEFSRRDSENDGIIHIRADVTDEARVNEALCEVAEQNGGRIDVLVCNAGFGISGAAEFTPNDEAKRQLEVNLFGTVNCVKGAIPIMRKQGGGRIICLSSVAAPCAIPFQTWYSVSKSAINTYVLALRNEVAPFNISVSAIMPGDIKTGFTGARAKSPVGDDVYGGRIARSVATMEKDEQNGMSPEKAGEFIARVASKEKGRPLYTIGGGYKCLVLLSRLLPPALVNKVIGMLYAK